jgi:hypothetical protein
MDNNFMTKDKLVAEKLARDLNRDETDGWAYRVEAYDNWFIIIVYDEEGIRLGSRAAPPRRITACPHPSLTPSSLYAAASPSGKAL